MRLRRPTLVALVLSAALALATAAGAVTVPASFVVENAVPGVSFTQPTSIAWLPGGRMLVLEKAGRLWSVTNGVKSAQPMLDINAEVFDNADRGALGLAVDPNYLANHYVYLMYEVDPDTNGVDTNSYGFGRITRYQVSSSDSTKLDPASRTILLGVNWPNGPVSASTSHGIGDLRFGTDGSLLASNGDGAEFNTVDAGGLEPGAFGPGKTSTSEDIGAFRSQDILSLNGKILRINPANGQGYPSNPFWDGNPSSVRSRVWVYGLRNPFRITLKPGTGSTDPTAGNPGTIYIGDVGMNTWEETNIARTGGLNFGWPCYEGAAPHSGYQNAHPASYDCSTIGTSINPGPLTGPAAYWNHSSSVTSTPPGIYGNCSTGGAWYTGNTYPASYKNKYFFCDYGQNWIGVATVDPNDVITAVSYFGTSMEAPVCLRTDPATGELLYISITTGQIRRIRYTGSLSNTPVAVATATPMVGVAPLNVNFSSAGSFNPSGQPYTLTWLFGDGQGSAAANPSHTYTVPGRYAAVLTADDGAGGIGRDTVVVIALASASFPTTAVLDDFNRANGPLTTPWVDPMNNLNGLSVSSNALAQTCCYGIPVWGATRYGANQEAYVTLTALTANAPEYDLMLKLQNARYDAPHVEVRYDNSTKQLFLSTWDAASGWVGLGTPIAATFVAGDKLGARAYENGVVEVYKNGALLGSRDASAWSYARFGGYLGLTLDAATTSKLDDFGGGDIVINTNTPPVATIDLPADGSFYSLADSVRMAGHATDAQQTAASLLYNWDVYLHHNNHTHPDVFQTTNTAGAFMPDDHEDGTGVWYELRFWVTDNQTLADTASVSIYPAVDLTPGGLAVSPPTPEDHGPAFYSFWLRNLGPMRSRMTHWVVRADGIAIAAGDTMVAGEDSVMVNTYVASGPAQGGYTLRVKVDSLDVQHETDETDNAMTIPLTITPPTAAAAGAAVPRQLALSAARPNPSAGAVSWSLDLPRASRVEVRVYDLMGRTVWTDPARDYGAGRWSLRWGGVDDAGRLAAPGVYLARVSAGDRTFVRRFAVLR